MSRTRSSALGRVPVIVGIDEAGRGALAGPVVAGACVLTAALFRRRKPLSSWSPFKRPRVSDCFIADSKQLTASLREIAYEWITRHCNWGVGIVPADFIEEEGILAATERAMHLALEDLSASGTIPTYLLVDGRDHFFFPYPHTPIVRGDSLEPCIAAASIIAKVTRDRIMVEEEKRHPHFRFAHHKGYGTREHIASIQRHGVSPLHRPYFLGRILSNSLKATRAVDRPRSTQSARREKSES